MAEPAVDRVLAAARARLGRRAQACELADELRSGAIVVDTRPVAQRARDGELPGALVVERNELEWRLDPTSPDRHAAVDGPEHRVVIVCDEGYASSLAAVSLLDLGLTDVTDLEGGFQAWRLLAHRPEGQQPQGQQPQGQQPQGQQPQGQSTP